ncbi:MAG: hypothetical protein HDQ88_07020 [Clostridia bacterium]|nr:hypothetical protein [Clostridia bacterium]
MANQNLRINAGELLNSITTATKFMTPPAWASDNSIANSLRLYYNGERFLVQGLNGHALFSREVPAVAVTGDKPEEAWDAPVLVVWEGVTLLQGVLKAKGKHARVELSVTDDAVTVDGVAAKRVVNDEWADTWRKFNEGILGNPEYIEGHIPVEGTLMCDAAGAKKLVEIFKACAPNGGVTVKKGLVPKLEEKQKHRNSYWEFSGNDTRIIWMAWRGDADNINERPEPDTSWMDEED